MPDPLWGAETQKALANFRISGEPVPPEVVRWLGRIKAAAARANAELGVLDADRAGRIASAADRVAAGELDDQFPVDVFQTGSGTSTNMNVNEVVARLAGPDVHPNDHVNLGQSSNDVFPTAVHLAALEGVVRRLVPALRGLEDALREQAEAQADVVKAGRTHLMDAVPMTLGQELGGWRAQVSQSVVRLEAMIGRLGQVPLGGTAVGTGLLAHPDLARLVRERLGAETGLVVSAPADPFEAQGARDGLVECSGALRGVAVSLAKIANDLRLLASGPRTGLGELVLPELQKGSSIMPGKVNPVIPEVVVQVAAQVIGNDAAIGAAALQAQLQLAAVVPVMARNLMDSLRLLTAASTALAEQCVRGLRPDVERSREHAERTLAAATVLNRALGYDRATAIVRAAATSGRSLREEAVAAGVDPALLDEVLDPARIARGRS